MSLKSATVKKSSNKDTSTAKNTSSEQTFMTFISSISANASSIDFSKGYTDGPDKDNLSTRLQLSSEDSVSIYLQ
jgi:hypothetical protein